MNITKDIDINGEISHFNADFKTRKLKWCNFYTLISIYISLKVRYNANFVNLIRITILKWLQLDLGRREGGEDLRRFNWGEKIILKYGMKRYF